jgi:cellobiose transport system substrate-binding protein
MARKKRHAVVGAAVVAAIALAGCSSSGGSSPTAADTGSSTSVAATPNASGGSTPSADNTPVTLTVGLFGTFGFKEAGLYDEYMKLHPNVTIKEDDVEQSGDYWTALQTKLAAGSGLDDIQGIEIGFVADVVANHADQFVDFNKALGADAQKVKDSFYDWKWQMASTTDGKTLGLGTDAGPEAMCYRPDLFKAAGLPTDRDTLSKDWSTWDGFIKLGQQYESSPTKPKGSSFIDNPSSIFSAAVYQGKEAYDTTDGKPDYKNSDGVKTAWNFASQAATAGITAGIAQWGDDWNKAFANGAFATISCPAWMLGYITGQAGDAYKGKWDVASLPGGAANWGGSWLGVPAGGKHEAAAVALAQWLTAPEQQVKMFTSQAHVPSSKTAAEDPAVASATSDYFNGAPIGKIFGDSASKLQMTPIGPFDTQIQTAITNALGTIVTNKVKPDDAWKAAVNAADQAIGG